MNSTAETKTLKTGTARAIMGLAIASILHLAVLAPAQTLTWTGAINGDILNAGNWNPPVSPFGFNLVFDGSVSNANATFAPPEGQGLLAVGSITLLANYGGEFRVKATQQVRDFTVGMEIQRDEAIIFLTGALTINGGTVTIEDTSFVPTIASGERRSLASLQTLGSTTLAGGRLRLRHLTSHANMESGNADLTIQGNFVWSGGILDFSATESINRKSAQLNLTGNWVQSTPGFFLQGNRGLVSLISQTSQTISANGVPGNFATFPGLAVPLAPMTIPANLNIYCSGGQDNISLIIGDLMDFQATAVSTTAVLGAGISLGPRVGSELRLGTNRRISSGGSLGFAGGKITATAPNTGIDFAGTLFVDATTFLQSPATIDITGSGSFFRGQSWNIADDPTTTNFIMNFGANTDVRVVGGGDGSRFTVEGAADINLPPYIIIAGPNAHPTANKPWSANADMADLPNVVVLNSGFPFFNGNYLQYGNPLNMLMDTITMYNGSRVEIRDARIVDVTNAEIYNRGRIRLTDGAIRRPTRRLRFTNTAGVPVSFYVIERDPVVGEVQDSDKNLDGESVQNQLPSVTFEIISGGITVETEVFNSGNPFSGLFRFLETGVFNYTFRNPFAMPLRIRNAENPSINNNGELRAIGGDFIRMIYIDPNGSGGPTEVVIGVVEDGGDNTTPEPALFFTQAHVAATEALATFSATIKNGGTADAGALNVSVYYNREFPPTAGETADFSTPIGGLPADQEFNFFHQLPTPAVGMYNAWFFVDSLDQIPEGDEDDNISGPHPWEVLPGAAPDLIISNFSAAAAGSGVTFTAEVTNQGTAGAPPCTLALSYDGGPTNDTANVPGIDAGGTAEIILFRIDSPAGTFTATATVDSGAVVAESDESNNSTTSTPYTTETVGPNSGKRMTITAARADNVPITVSVADLTGRTNGSTQFTRTFADTTQNVTFGAPFFFNGQSFIGWVNPATDEVLSTNPVTSIAVEAGKTIRAEYTPKAPPRPDLVVKTFAASFAGANLVFTAQVSNIGDAASGPCTLAVFYNRTGAVSGPSGDATLSVEGLAVGQTVTKQVTYQFAIPGTYDPEAFVDSTTVVVESAETNNRSFLTGANGTLTVEDPSAGSRRMTFSSGRVDNVPVTIDLSDLAGLKNGVTTFTRQYGSSGTVLSISAPAAIGSQTFVRWFDAGAGKIVSTQRSTFVRITDGRTIRAEYSQPEPPAPDLVIDFLRADTLGAGVRFTARVHNLGNAASAACTLALFYDRATIPVDGIGADQTISIEALAPDASTTKQLFWVDTPAGYYTPWAFVDSTFAVAESAEGNNAAGLDTGGIRMMYFTSANVENVPVSIDVTDVNGFGGGDTSFVRTYEGRGAVGIAAPSTHNGRSFVRWFDPGTQTVVSTSPATLATVVDGRTLRAEYEGPVVPAPDLVIDSLTAVVSAPGVVDFTIRVANAGNAASIGCALVVFLDSATIPTSGVGASGAVGVEGLAPGGITTKTIQLTSVPIGVYRPWGFVDSDNSVAESSEDNNAAPLDSGNSLGATAEGNGSSGAPNGDDDAGGSSSGGTLDTGGNGTGGGSGNDGNGNGNGDDDDDNGDGDDSGGGIDINPPQTGGRSVLITSGRADSVPITVSPFDESGRSDGVTTFTRTFSSATSQVHVSAPQVHDGSNFVRWFNATDQLTLSSSTNAEFEPRNGLTVRAEYDGAGAGGGGAGGPDLVIDVMTAVSAGPDVTYTMVVSNIGGGPAAACTLALFFNRGTAPTDGIGADRTVAVPALAAGATQTFTIDVIDFNPRGYYTPWALIDSANVVSENSETNNVNGGPGSKYLVWDPVNALKVY